MFKGPVPSILTVKIHKLDHEKVPKGVNYTQKKTV